MDKRGLIREVAHETGYSQGLVETAIDATINVIYETLRDGESVQVLDFGTFEVKNRAARMGRNPRTNEPVPIPARRLPNFRFATKFRKRISK